MSCHVWLWGRGVLGRSKGQGGGRGRWAMAHWVGGVFGDMAEAGDVFNWAGTVLLISLCIPIYFIVGQIYIY